MLVARCGRTGGDGRASARPHSRFSPSGGGGTRLRAFRGRGNSKLRQAAVWMCQPNRGRNDGAIATVPMSEKNNARAHVFFGHRILWEDKKKCGAHVVFDNAIVRRSSEANGLGLGLI